MQWQATLLMIGILFLVVGCGSFTKLERSNDIGTLAVDSRYSQCEDDKYIVPPKGYINGNCNKYLVTEDIYIYTVLADV